LSNWIKILKKEPRTRIMCGRRIQGAEEADILADLYLQVVESGPVGKAV